MNAPKYIAAAVVLVAVASPVQAGSFRDWLLADAPGHRASAPARESDARLDLTARMCMACHEDAAGHVSLGRGRNGGAPAWTGSGSAGHPLGTPYARAASARPDRYRAAATLDPRITLVDGRVTCISCHRIADPETHGRRGLVKTAWGAQHLPGGGRSSLSVGPRVSDLCTSCHVK